MRNRRRLRDDYGTRVRVLPLLHGARQGLGQCRTKSDRTGSHTTGASTGQTRETSCPDARHPSRRNDALAQYCIAAGSAEDRATTCSSTSTSAGATTGTASTRYGPRLLL